MPVKLYKTGIVFPVTKTIKDITHYSLKLGFKVANGSLYSIAFQYFGAIKAHRKFASSISR